MSEMTDIDRGSKSAEEATKGGKADSRAAKKVPEAVRELAARVKKARKEKNWSLEELSRKLNNDGYPTSQNKLFRLENKPPEKVDAELVRRLEELLGVSLSASSDQIVQRVIETYEGDNLFLGDNSTGDLRDKQLKRIRATFRNIPPPVTGLVLNAMWIGLHFLAKNRVHVTSYVTPQAWETAEHRAMLSFQEQVKRPAERIRIFILDEVSEKDQLHEVVRRHLAAGVKCFLVLRDEAEKLRERDFPRIRTIDFGIFDNDVFEWALNKRKVVSARLVPPNAVAKRNYEGYWRALLQKAEQCTE